MTGFFMSKKQKQIMRERRKKKKLANKGLSPEEIKDALQKGKGDDHVSKKRRRSTDKDSPPNNNNKAESNDAKDLTILVPANLLAKEAKKFRKDARRKAKSEGKNVDKLVFVIEGEVRAEKDEPPKKKRKFPCINELVALEKQKETVENKLKVKENVSAEYKARYIAMDCEMVGTGPNGRRSALARVSCTDWDGNVLFDSFVKVPDKITDFRTHVSGVRWKDVKGEKAVSFKYCQDKVAELIKGKILVGHALKNDLDALLLEHPKNDLRDTSKYRQFQRLDNNKKWRPRKLKDLVKEHCDIDIQTKGEAHDSIDDAKANMELFKSVHVEWEKELELKNLKRKR